MQKQALVSIIIPTYNRAHLIGETLDSVLAQTYTNWECIIVDDGSSDNTDEVVGAYLKKDKRFKYYHRPDEHLPGGNGARNFGFKMSQGEFVNWLDSDDLFSENKIEEQIKLLKKTDFSIGTCKWARFVKKDEFFLKELQIYKNYQSAKNLIIDYGEKGMFFPSHSFLISKEILSKSRLWNEDLKINQDGEFFCRVLVNAKEIVFSEKSYVLYRLNSNNKTSSFSSLIKAKHAVMSWKLIENQLAMVDGDFSKYIEKAKFYVYNKLRNNFYNVIEQNSEFFEKQIEFYSFRLRVIRKLIKFFS